MVRDKRKNFIVQAEKILFRLQVKEVWCIRHRGHNGEINPFYAETFDTEQAAINRARELNA